MKKNNVILGVILLILGGIALLNNLGITHYSLSVWRLWPLVLLLPGLSFELSYFNKNGPVGLLVPGGILTTYGSLFMFCSFFGYGHMAYLWPLFLGGVGVGLFQLYYFGNRDRALFYVSASFLGFATLAIFFSMLSLKGSFVLPIVLIVIGTMMILGPKRHKQPLFTVEYENEDKNEDAQL